MTRKVDSLVGLLQLHQITRLFWALLRDRRMPLLLKLQAVAGIFYIFSPLDVTPDFITGIGLLDDLIVALVIMQAFIELAPRDVVDEYCSRMKIDQNRLFTSVPRTIEDAIEIYEMAVGRGMGRRGRGRGREEGVVEQRDTRGAGEPDRYRKYSAYRKDQE